MSKYIGTKAVNLSTTSADVTGNADIDGDLTVGGNLTVSGTTITVDHATAQTVDLGDDDKIRLGDGNDLQIYHDGTNSFIDEAGTGNLRIRASSALNLQTRNTADTAWVNSIIADDGAGVRLFTNGSKKLETTSTGVNITGTLTSDGLEVDAGSGTNAGVTIRMGTGNSGANDSFIGFENSAGTEIIRTRYDNPLTSYVISSDTSGDILSVTRSGNVGVGTQTPQSYSNQTSLTINGSTTGRLDLQGGGVQGGTIFSTNGTGLTVQTGYGKPLILESGTTADTQFKNNGAEKMRLTQYGDLLVGKTSTDIATEGVKIGATGQASTFTRDGDTPVFIRRNTGGGDLIKFYQDTNTVGQIAVQSSNILDIVSNNASLYLQPNNKVSSSSNNIWTRGHVKPWQTNYHDLGASNYRWDVAYINEIDFGGASGNVTSKTLDDYEEGTWTPYWSASGATPTLTYSTQIGRYTKVGDLVVCWARLTHSSISGGTGYARLSGLPFNPSSFEEQAGGQIGYSTAFDAGSTPIAIHADNGVNYCWLYYQSTAAGDINSTPNISSLKSTGSIYFSVVYKVA